jgi:hypothetical protein
VLHGYRTLREVLLAGKRFYDGLRASVSGGRAAMWTVARFVTEFAVAYAALWTAAEFAIIAMRR